MFFHFGHCANDLWLLLLFQWALVWIQKTKYYVYRSSDHKSPSNFIFMLLFFFTETRVETRSNKWKWHHQQQHHQIRRELWIESGRKSCAICVRKFGWKEKFNSMQVHVTDLRRCWSSRDTCEFVWSDLKPQSVDADVNCALSSERKVQQTRWRQSKFACESNECWCKSSESIKCEEIRKVNDAKVKWKLKEISSSANMGWKKNRQPKQSVSKVWL